MEATLGGTTEQIFRYLRDLIKHSEGYPGFKPKILREYQPDKNLSAIMDYKEDLVSKKKEPNRFQLESSDVKWIDESLVERKAINWKVRSFDLTYQIGELGFVNITNDDLSGGIVTFTQKLKAVDQTDDRRASTKYTLTFKISNCRARNVALEALDLFKNMFWAHLDHMKQEFSGGFFKTIGNIIT